MSFIDKNGTRINANVRGLDGLTRTIYKTNICGKNAGAIFMRVIFARDRKAEYAKISLDGLEKDGPALITWD